MWTFIQTGRLLTPSGDPASHTWYSGHDEHANKPEDEGLAGLGPLPRGTYTFSKDVFVDRAIIYLPNHFYDRLGVAR